MLKVRKQHSLPPCVVTQFCTTVVRWLCFFCRISWYRLRCRNVSCRRPTPRLQMILLHPFSIYHLSFPSGCQTCPSPWPRCVSRPCGCRWTSHSLSWLFRRTWIRRRARRCSPVCCCLNSSAMTTTVTLKRQSCRLTCVSRWESSWGDIGPFLIPFRCSVPWIWTTLSHDVLEKAHRVLRPPDPFPAGSVNYEGM